MTGSNPPAGNRAGWSVPVLLALVVSEYRKTLSTAAWWALLIPAALICGLVGLISAEAGGLAFTVSTTLALVLPYGGTFAAIFGVVCSSAEFRHRTATTSYLAAAGRPQLLVAKAALAAAVGAGYAVVCSVIGTLGMLLGGSSFTDDFGDTVEVVVVAALLFALWAVLGVGLGALLANQLAAIVGLLVYLLLVEPLINRFSSLSNLGPIKDFLPAGASSSALTVLASNPGSGLDDLFGSTLPWWVSFMIFLGYVLVVYAAGTAVAQTRDVT
jgi:ABC-2 type transport system permease protein